MKFYERAEFIKLNKAWKKRLERSGFHDIEDSKEELYQPNLRTNRWERRDQVLEFFLSLDEYLNTHDIPKRDRKILELYSKGEYVKEISALVGLSYSHTRLIIDRYEAIVMELY